MCLFGATALGQVTFGDDLFSDSGLVTEVDENEDATPFDDILVTTIRKQDSVWAYEKCLQT